MRKITSSIMAALLSVSFVGADMLQASAATIYVAQGQNASSDITLAAERGERRIYRKNHRANRNFRHRPNDRFHNRPSNRRHYWRGHRGYDHYRPGYRRHGDLWFPLAAFAAGAIISGAIANDRA